MNILITSLLSVNKLRFKEEQRVGGTGRDVDNLFHLGTLSLKYWLNILVVMFGW